MSASRYYSAREVATLLRRDPHTIRDWIIDGCPTSDGPVKLEAVKLGKQWTIREDWLSLFETRVRPVHESQNFEIEFAAMEMRNRNGKGGS